MGRTRLWGIRVAGVRVAVEVPPGAPWASASEAWEPEEDACSPCEPDVYVGVRIAVPAFPRCESVVYSSRGRTFEVARCDGEWWIATHGRGRHERVLRFDDRFAAGEVVIHPDAAQRVRHPLEHPIDELIALHRTARAGGLVLRGTAVLQEGRALVFAGPRQPTESRQGGWAKAAPAESQGGVALRPDDDGVRVHRMPQVGRQGGASFLDARLDAIHLIESASAVYSHRIDADEAAEELVLNGFAPVHDPESAERMAENALQLARRVPVLRLGLPEEDRVVPFTWGQRRAALAFAPPYPA